MRKTMLALLVSAITWTSCVKQKESDPKPLTQKQMNQKVDSIVAARSKVIEQQAQKDLQYRLKIEVKGKADSLIRVHRSGADTIKTPKL